jgi:hypothetical protein
VAEYWDREHHNQASAKSLSLSGAQNATVLGLSPNVTRFPITITTSGAPHVPPTRSLLPPLTGSFTPSYFLATFDEILLNAEGIGVQASPLNFLTMGSAAAPDFATPTFRATTTSYGETGVASITAIPQSPTSVLLQYSGVSFPRYYTSKSSKCPTGGSIYWDNSSVPISYSAKVQLLVGSNPTWTLGAVPSSLYLTNLTPDSNYTWNAWITATYQQTYSWDYCGATGSKIVSPPTISPPSMTLSTTGWANTVLAILPAQPYMLTGAWPSQTPPAIALSANWNNTMLAASKIWLNDSAGAVFSHTLAGYNITDVQPFASLPTGLSYTAVITSQSRAGTINSSQSPRLAAGSGGPYPAEQALVSCGFNLDPPRRSYLVA